MTGIAFCRKPRRFLGSLKFGEWALRTSDRGGQDKANWRSRTRRPVSREKRLSAHWFLEAPWLAVSDIPSRPDGAFRAFRGISMLGATALADFNLQISAFHLISCASLRFCALDVLQLLLWAYPTRIVGT